MPYFSIIIPVYNVAPYLRECLDSVLAQTFTDWEAICVDDGSTDGSGAILDEYAAKDKRFRVIHQANAGVSAARNKALDVLNGEYVCFVDSDDKVDSCWLLFARNLLSTKNDIAMMSFKHWYGGVCESVEQTRIVCYDTRKQVQKFFKKHIYGFTPFLFFCRRQILEGLFFDNRLRRDEDVAYFSLVLLRANSLVKSDYVGYCYRQRANSADHIFVTDVDVAKFIEVATEDYLDMINGDEIRICYKEWLSQRVVSDMLGYINKDGFCPLETLKAFRRAVRVGALDLRYIPICRKIVIWLIYSFGSFSWRVFSVMFSIRRFIKKR